MKGGNILSLLRDYDSRKSMDGSAPDAPEVSADIDSPEKPESVSGAGGFETDRTRRRTPKESEDELTAPYKKAGYKTQYSTKFDEDGNIVEAKWGEKGSRRPDAYDVENNRVVEVKNYKVETESGRNNLVNNVRRQTDASKRNYGDDVEIVDVIDLRGHNMTVGDMEELTDKIEKKCPEVGLDYRF